MDPLFLDMRTRAAKKPTDYAGGGKEEEERRERGGGASRPTTHKIGVSLSFFLPPPFTAVLNPFPDTCAIVCVNKLSHRKMLCLDSCDV